VKLAFAVHCSFTSGAAVQKAGYMQYKNRVDTGDELDEHNIRAAEIVAKKSPDQNTKVRIIVKFSANF